MHAYVRVAEFTFKTRSILLFHRNEGMFDGNVRSVPTKPVLCHNTVTGNNKRSGISAHCHANGPRRGITLHCNISVCCRLSIRNPADGTIDHSIRGGILCCNRFQSERLTQSPGTVCPEGGGTGPSSPLFEKDTRWTDVSDQSTCTHQRLNRQAPEISAMIWFPQ